MFISRLDCDLCVFTAVQNETLSSQLQVISMQLATVSDEKLSLVGSSCNIMRECTCYSKTSHFVTRHKKLPQKLHIENVSLWTWKTQLCMYLGRVQYR